MSYFLCYRLFFFQMTKPCKTLVNISLFPENVFRLTHHSHHHFHLLNFFNRTADPNSDTIPLLQLYINGSHLKIWYSLNLSICWHRSTSLCTGVLSDVYLQLCLAWWYCTRCRALSCVWTMPLIFVWQCREEVAGLPPKHSTISAQAHYFFFLSLFPIQNAKVFCHTFVLKRLAPSLFICQ